MADVCLFCHDSETTEDNLLINVHDEFIPILAFKHCIHLNCLDCWDGLLRGGFPVCPLCQAPMTHTLVLDMVYGRDKYFSIGDILKSLKSVDLPFKEHYLEYLKKRNQGRKEIEEVLRLCGDSRIANLAYEAHNQGGEQLLLLFIKVCRLIPNGKRDHCIEALSKRNPQDMVIRVLTLFDSFALDGYEQKKSEKLPDEQSNVSVIEHILDSFSAYFLPGQDALHYSLLRCVIALSKNFGDLEGVRLILDCFLRHRPGSINGALTAAISAGSMDVSRIIIEGIRSGKYSQSLEKIKLVENICKMKNSLKMVKLLKKNGLLGYLSPTEAEQIFLQVALQDRHDLKLLEFILVEFLTRLKSSSLQTLASKGKWDVLCLLRSKEYPMPIQNLGQLHYWAAVNGQWKTIRHLQRGGRIDLPIERPQIIAMLFDTASAGHSETIDYLLKEYQKKGIQFGPDVLDALTYKLEMRE